jgi:hypothetical protein
MRGRSPDSLTIRPGDEPILLRLARGQSWPWFQVQRARLVLAIAAGARAGVVADEMQCEATTVWRACRRYRREGLEGLLADGRQQRSGRSAAFSPPPACPDRRAGVPGTGGPGAAHHPLEP